MFQSKRCCRPSLNPNIYYEHPAARYLLPKFMPISFLGCASRFCRCFRTSVTLIKKILVRPGMLPCLRGSLNTLTLYKSVSRSYLVPGADAFLRLSGHVVSYLVLQACISFYTVSLDKSVALLFMPCSHKSAVNLICFLSLTVGLIREKFSQNCHKMRHVPGIQTVRNSDSG